MKILLLSAYYPPDTGSAAHLFYDLGGVLSKEGHDVTVVTGFPSYHAVGDLQRYRRRLWMSDVQPDGVRVVRVAVPQLFRDTAVGRGLWQFSCAAAFAMRALTLKRPDVTLVYSPPLPLALTSLLLRGLRRVPFIVNIQDLFPQSAIDLGILRNAFLIGFFRRLERTVYRRADLITVHSNGNRDHVLHCGGAAERTIVLPNWVDTEWLKPGERRNDFSREHDLDHCFVVSFAGVLGHSQDVDVILEAALTLRDEPEIVFLIVGDGVEKTRLQDRARELALPNVRFLPMQPRETYPSLLAASDVSLATLRADVLTPVVPSKILSIMAAGRPVVAAMPPDGDAPALIREARCGQALQPGDAQTLAETLRGLYHDSQECQRLGDNGRRYAEQHLSLRVGARHYLGLFARLTDRSGQT